jgi:LysM repeat protein
MADTVHIVEPGDTLTQLVVTYGLAPQPINNSTAAWAPAIATAQAVALRNGIADPNKIKIGQSLIMSTLDSVPLDASGFPDLPLPDIVPIMQVETLDLTQPEPASPVTKIMLAAAVAFVAWRIWKA